MARPTKAPIDPDDAPLKRLGGGRWQTRDERFTIEPQSGTWVVVDADQTDELGLPLVRGPFASLTAAKEAIASARSSGPATSPLAGRIEQLRRDPAGTPDARPAPKPEAEPTQGVRSEPMAERQAMPEPPREAEAARDRTPTREAEPARDRTPAPVRATPKPADPPEPGWLSDLDAATRGRARRLMARLVDDGIDDAEGLVRRDVVGGVPALAAQAIARRLAGLGEDAAPADVVRLLADGRDDGLGVRWRLVDGNGRPIVLDAGGRRR